MLKPEQIKEVLTALVRTGWMLSRHVDEAMGDVMKKLQELEEEKPEIVRVWERMDAATDNMDRIHAIVAFNKICDKLPEDVKDIWSNRRDELLKKWLLEK